MKSSTLPQTFFDCGLLLLESIDLVFLGGVVRDGCLVESEFRVSMVGPSREAIGRVRVFGRLLELLVQDFL